MVTFLVSVVSFCLTRATGWLKLLFTGEFRPSLVTKSSQQFLGGNMSGAELNTGVSGLHRKELTIIVNGEEKHVATHELSFNDVVNLAYNGDPPTGPDYVFTVTYRKAEGKKHEGTLTEGQEVKIKDGTIFNVTATNKS
jgi:multiubiquitin